MHVHILINSEFSVCGAELPWVELMIHREYKKTNKQIHQKKQNKQTKPNKNKQVDTENRVVVMRGEGAKGRWNG